MSIGKGTNLNVLIRTSEPSEETLKLWRNLERRVWLLNLNQQEPTSSLSDMNERLRDSFESDLQTCKDSLQCAQEAHNTCMTVEGSQVGPLYYYPEPLIEGGTQPSEGYLSAVYDVNSHSELLEGSLSGHPRAAAENSFLEQRIATDFSSIHQDRPSAENLEQVLAMYEEPSACDDSSSHNRRPLVESLQQSKRLKVVDASNELMGCQKPSTVSNVPWNLPNEEELPRSYFSQERAMSDLLTWWEERDITAMMSRAAYQGRDILRDFEEFKQTLVAENKGKTVSYEHLPSIGEMHQDTATHQSGQLHMRVAGGSQMIVSEVYEQQLLKQEQLVSNQEQIRGLPTARRTCLMQAQKIVNGPVFEPSTWISEKEMNHHRSKNLSLWNITDAETINSEYKSINTPHDIHIPSLRHASQ